MRPSVILLLKAVAYTPNSIYEDRAPHVQAFREFFDSYNNTIARSGRKQLVAEVVQVAALTVRHLVKILVESS